MTTDSLPAPLVPADVDLRGYEWMPLYGDRLLGSETWILASADGKVAALHLWWRAFGHEVPAGSLPSDDRLLSAAAGYGVAVAAWRAIKAEALRGWVKCSDGRLYHPFLADLALQAWETRRADIVKKEAERARKKAKRAGAAPAPSAGIPPENGSEDAPCPPDNTHPSAGQNGDVRRTNAECPPDNQDLSAAPSAGIPPENALKGKERKGKERSTGIVKSSAGGPRAHTREEARPPAADGDGDGVSALRAGVLEAFERWFDLPDRPLCAADEDLFAAWIAAGAERGLSPAATADAALAEVRRQFGRLAARPDGGQPPRSLKGALDEDVRREIASSGRSPRGDAVSSAPDPLVGRFAPATRGTWRVRVQGFQRLGAAGWPSSWGPPPGERGCEAPADIVAEVLGTDAAMPHAAD